VIRSASERGLLYLIDDRFACAEARSRLPPWRGSTRRFCGLVLHVDDLAGNAGAEKRDI
jgi:Rad3-related DNA helicase